MPRPLTAQQQIVYDYIRDRILSRGYGPTVREIGEHMNIKSPNGVMCHLRALERKGVIVRKANKSRAIELTEELPRSQDMVLPVVGTVQQGRCIIRSGGSVASLKASHVDSDVTDAKPNEDANANGRRNAVSGSVDAAPLSHSRSDEKAGLGAEVGSKPLVGDQADKHESMSNHSASESMHTDASRFDLARFSGSGRIVLQVADDALIDGAIAQGDSLVVQLQSSAKSAQLAVVRWLEHTGVGEPKYIELLRRVYFDEGQVRLQPVSRSMPATTVDQVEIVGVVVGLLRTL